MSIPTVAIAGLGSRGRMVYAAYALNHPNSMEITAVADIDGKRVDEAAATFRLPAGRCFDCAGALLKQDRLADALLLCTPDGDHYETAMKALEKGYHLLLEKPIATTERECLEIAEAAKKHGRHVVVCHVLRYAPFYQAVKGVISSGEIGGVVHINAVEGVGYFHQAHSFVRGAWRDTKETCPMILAKCCHDADILSWLLDRRAVSVSSYGGLYYFKRENAPEGSADRCLGGCGAKEACPYDAEKIYITNEDTGVARGNAGWPADVLARPATEQSVREALETGPYGRCVFRCDNDAVDHQTVNLLFDGGVTAHLCMSAFSARVYRTINVMGTLGEIDGDMRTNKIKVTAFGAPPRVIDLSETISTADAHGGGDERIMDSLLKLLAGEGNAETSIDRSIESHAICFAAEKSRLNGGVPQDVRRVL